MFKLTESPQVSLPFGGGRYVGVLEGQTMGRYVDGFVIPVRKDRIEDYRRIAEQAAPIWKEYGALDYWECVGDDLDVKGLVAFPHLAQVGPDETVVFAWVVFESREQRDLANAKIVADPRLRAMVGDNPPFDMQRMAYGGVQGAGAGVSRRTIGYS